MHVAILGGGQLARMLALEGRRLGMRFRFLEPKRPSPVDELGTVVRAGYDTPDALAELAAGAAVATYEFENVPVGAAHRLAELVPVRPGPEALRVTQDRLLEKDAFVAAGVPTAPYRGAASEEELARAVEALGGPVVAKTRRLGYDGKGQALVRSPDEAPAAWRRLGGVSLLVESLVPFERELSIIGVRGLEGDIACYPLVENEHRDGILRKTLAPAANLRPGLEESARAYLTALLARFHYVGVLALELFELDGELLANEMACRVHNSGHWTLDGALTSQFENHLRAICGLPVGGTRPRGPSAMVNLLGSVPDLGPLLRLPGARVHLYEKPPGPSRKVGHVNVVAETPELLAERVAALEALLP